MLLGEMKVCFSHFGGKHQAVMFETSAFSEFLELFWPEHLSQRVGRVYRAINDDMSHVDSFRSKFGIERLAKHSAPTHRRSMRVLAPISAHGGSGRSDQEGAFAPLLHQRKN